MIKIYNLIMIQINKQILKDMKIFIKDFNNILKINLNLLKKQMKFQIKILL